MIETSNITSIEEVQIELAKRRYVSDRSLATILYLAQGLDKPVLLEGNAGVGKTEVAKVMASVLGTPLIRLQCYEGLDANHALYEWNYSKQLLAIRGHESGNRNLSTEVFSEEFLIKRPLLEALYPNEQRKSVLLIDEIDRADEEFEAFLLEILSDFQVTIPELGTISAQHKPFVIITSNRTRETSDALKRRCLYHWVKYPNFDQELNIVLTKVEGISEDLAMQVCSFMQLVREEDYLFKKPGVAETLDWAKALVYMHRDTLDRQSAEETMGCLMKFSEDVERMRSNAESLIERARTYIAQRDRES